MSDHDDNEFGRREMGRGKRRRKHLERLGFADPRCLFCGMDELCCLELDHLPGREFDPKLVWVLCANCHRIRTFFQKDHPPKLAVPTDPLEQVGRFVESLADYLEMSVTRLRDFGPMLCAEAAARSPRVKRDRDDYDGQDGAC